MIDPKTDRRRSGSKVGRYQLILRVAIGGMGEIWAARRKRGGAFGPVVALKTILPELLYEAHYETMFLDEARLASRIDHPNVVRVLEVGEDDGVLYQVMEWIDGSSLWSLLRALKGRAVPVEVAARILFQTCAGLHAAHELTDDRGQPLGLVHRDVSPQNILLTATGIVKVVDFGVAKYSGRGAAQTQAGELRGKVPYMSPEQITGQAVDRRADVFALGTLFFQLVSGKNPFLKSEDLLTLAAISSPDPAPPLTDAAPEVSRGLSDVVAHAMEKDPGHRTPTALAFLEAIVAEVPAAGAASTDQRVGAFVREALGDKRETRLQRVEAALRRLDEASPGSAPASPATAVEKQSSARTWRWWGLAMGGITLAVVAIVSMYPASRPVESATHPVVAAASVSVTAPSASASGPTSAAPSASSPRR